MSLAWINECISVYNPLQQLFFLSEPSKHCWPNGESVQTKYDTTRKCSRRVKRYTLREDESFDSDPELWAFRRKHADHENSDYAGTTIDMSSHYASTWQELKNININHYEIIWHEKLLIIMQLTKLSSLQEITPAESIISAYQLSLYLNKIHIWLIMLLCKVYTPKIRGKASLLSLTIIRKW